MNANVKRNKLLAKDVFFLESLPGFTLPEGFTLQWREFVFYLGGATLLGGGALYMGNDFDGGGGGGGGEFRKQS